MRIDEVVEHLKSIVEKSFKFDDENFIEFGAGGNEDVYAIDGSSIKLFDAYTFSIYARRVGWVKANEDGIISMERGKIKIDVIYGENADSINDERREAEEMEVAKSLKGSIVLVDGCHVENVVGISKKSGMKAEGVPLLFAIRKYGDKIKPGKRWFYRIGETTYAVKFHPRSRFVFRVDYGGEDVGEMLSNVARYCNDISYLGYPYPLAEVHKLVKIDKEEADYIKQHMIHRAIKSGISMEDFEELFYDYHEYMEG